MLFLPKSFFFCRNTLYNRIQVIIVSRYRSEDDSFRRRTRQALILPSAHRAPVSPKGGLSAITPRTDRYPSTCPDPPSDALVFRKKTPQSRITAVPLTHPPAMKKMEAQTSHNPHLSTCYQRVTLRKPQCTCRHTIRRTLA